MDKFEKMYFCTNCRQKLLDLTNLYFIEENSQKGFCSEACIEKYYLPLVEYFEKCDLEIKEKDTLHTGNFDYLNNDNGLVEAIFRSPDEVYFHHNELSESYYIFHKKFPEGYTGISICHLYNQEPSFIYLCSVTDSKTVTDYYKSGQKAKILRKGEGESSEISSELKDFLEHKKSILLAKILENREVDDIPFEEFSSYESYVNDTVYDADEVYEIIDEDDDVILSHIKTFEKNGNSFFYVVLCTKYESKKETSKDQEIKNKVYPIVSCPTKKSKFYKLFQSDRVLTKAIKN